MYFAYYLYLQTRFGIKSKSKCTITWSFHPIKLGFFKILVSNWDPILIAHESFNPKAGIYIYALIENNTFACKCSHFREATADSHTIEDMYISTYVSNCSMMDYSQQLSWKTASNEHNIWSMVIGEFVHQDAPFPCGDSEQ